MINDSILSRRSFIAKIKICFREIKCRAKESCVIDPDEGSDFDGEIIFGH